MSIKFKSSLDVNGPVKTSGGTYTSGVDTKTDAGIVLPQGEAIYSENTGNYLRNIIQHSSGGDIEIGQDNTSIIGNITIKPGTSGDIKFYPSGSQDVTFDSSGNVGIGTSSPAVPLNIQASNAAMASNGIMLIQANSAATNDGGQMTFGTTSSRHAAIAGRQESTSGTAGYLQFGTRASSGDITERMRIDSTGNVGIGLTPTVKLHVSGTIQSTQGATTLQMYTTGGSGVISQLGTYPLTFLTNGSEAMRIDSSGNVGIGTTSLSAKLYVKGDSIGSTSGDSATHAVIRGARHHLEFKEIRTSNTSDWNSTTYKLQAKVDSTNHQSINFVSDGSYLEHIDIYTGNDSFNTRFHQNGNVGIGIATPSTLLHLFGGDATVTIQGSGTNSNSGVDFFPRDGSNVAHKQSIKGVGSSLTFLTGGNSGNSYVPSEKMRIDSSGNVGIGTDSPNATLHITDQSSSNTTFRISAQSNDENFAFIRHTDITANTSRLDFGTTYGYSTEVNAMSIFNGNVGIGTTSPTSALHVAGKTISTDGFTADGNTKKYFWRGSNTGNSGTIWKHIATMNLVGMSTRIKITGTGNTSFGAGVNTGHFTILAQVNNNNQLEGTWFTENGTYTVQDVYIVNNGSYSYSVYIQTGGYSEFAFEAVISQGAVSTHWTTVSTPTGGASLTKQWDVNKQLYVNSSGNVGIGTTSPSVKLDINSTDAIKVPVGTTAQRPTPANGMLRYSTTDNQFEGYADGAWGAIAGGGGGGGGGGTSIIERDTFSGNGSTTQFTLSTSVSDEINTQVYIDGVYQSKLNYSTAGNVLTFSSAPATGTNNIEVIHVTSVAVEGASALNKNTFTGDGSTTGFTLSAAPTSEDFTFVFIQGVYQEKSTYVVANNIITFSTAPQNGYTIEVMHIGAVNVQQSSYMEYDDFTGTGSQTAFTLVNGNPTDEKFTMVFLQGVYQEKSTYSLSNRVITFTTAPDNNYTIEIMSVNGGGLLTVPSHKPTVGVISSNTTAVANSVYVLTANLTLTLPANPQIGDSVKVSNRSGVATCVIGANNKKIMGANQNITLDTASASFELIYSGTDQGWVIIGQ